MAVNKTVEQIVFEGVDAISAVAQKGAGAVGQLRKSVDGVSAALAGIGVTVGAGAFVAMTLDALKATAALDDMAESTGASVEGLSAIQRVAKVGGHDFEGLTGQIGKMIKGLKDGGDEGSKTSRALDFLGIKAKDAGGNFRDTSEVLVELAQKLRGYQDDASKVLLVQDALGKGAERYIPLLKDIAEGTDLVAKTTRQQAEEAERAEKNINRLKVAMEDGRRELVNQFTPAIADFTEKLLAAKNASGGWLAGLNTLLNNAVEGGGDPAARIAAIDKELANTGRRSQSPTGANVGVLGGMSQSFLLQERAMLEALMKSKGRALTGMVEDPAGIHGAPASPRLGYKGDTGGGAAAADADRAAQRERDFRAGKALELEELGSADALGASEALAASDRKRDEQYQKFLESLQSGAQLRQRLEEEGERQADERLERDKMRLSTSVESLQASLMSELEVREGYYRDAERSLQQALEQKLITEEEYAHASMKLEMEKQKELSRLNDAELMRRTGAARIHHKLDIDSASTFFGGMSKLMNTNSRKMFEIGKVAATAEAVINTYRAAIGAYAALAPIPGVGPALGAAAAGAAIAFGMAQVQAIQSQSFGGGIAATGTFPASPTTGLPTGGQGGAQQTTIIKFAGSGGRGGQTFTEDDIRLLFDRINESTRDGGRFLLDRA